MGLFDFMKTEDKIVGKCFFCGCDVVEKVFSKDGKVSQKADTILSDGSCVCELCRSTRGGLSSKEASSLTRDSFIKKISSLGFSSPECFSPTKRMVSRSCVVGDGGLYKNSGFYFELDEPRGLINIPIRYKEHIRHTSDIIDFELIDNGQKTVDGASFLGAAVGGVAFGGAGAIVGSAMRNKKIIDKCSSLSIKIVFNSIESPVEYIHFVGTDASIGSLKRDFGAYNELMPIVQECLSVIAVIVKRNDSLNAAPVVAPPADSSSIIESIKKLSELHSQCILTDEEFSSKKSDLLARL